VTDGPIDVFVLAGGAGTRLRPLTHHVPKPLLPFLGQPLIHGWLRRLAIEDLRDVHLLVGRERHPFDPAVELGHDLGLRVRVHTEERPLGSGGAVRAALPAGNRTVLVINADIVTGTPIRRLLAAHLRGPGGATLLSHHVVDASGYGLLRLDGDTVVDFREKPRSTTGTAWINAGVYVLDRSVLDLLPSSGWSSLERELFPALVAAGAPMRAVPSTDGWADVGTRDRYLNAHIDALRGRLRWPATYRCRRESDGIHPTARLATTATVHPPVLIGQHAEIGPAATVGPNVVLGARVRVDRRSWLTDSVVHDHARLGTATDVHRSVIGAHSDVPDGAQVLGATWVADRGVPAARRRPARPRPPTVPEQGATHAPDRGLDPDSHRAAARRL
jgi:mannose-1-phosphate guanylyltransferase